MAIYLTGDTHGAYDSRKLFFKEFNKDDIIIVLGDFGYIFGTPNFEWFETDSDVDKYEVTRINALTEHIGCRILFLDGNHENFDRLLKFPTTELYGGKVHKVGDNCYHLIRGEVYNIEGKTFLAIGGAHSIDRMYREEGISWWSQENISEDDINNALENVKKFGGNVDYVLTHCCPLNMLKTVECSLPRITVDYFYDNRNEKLLQVVADNVKFNRWFMGHYHIDKEFDKYAVLYYDFYNISSEEFESVEV